MAAHTIKVLGKGCGSCEWTERLVREVVAESGADIEVIKLSKISEMIAYGAMATPAIVLDEKLVHDGGIPTKQAIVGWLAGLEAS
jgi:small redox-active disulfide protein 2